LLALAVAAVILGACGAQQRAEFRAGPQAAMDFEDVVGEADGAGAAWSNDAVAMAPAPAAQATAGPDAVRSGAGTESQPLAAGSVVGAASTRKIIKNATMSLEVDSVNLAISRIEGIAAQSGGYVLEARTDFSNPYRRRAFTQIAVPVDRFEVALQRIREAAGTVLSEEASGVDVSQEFVDVQSQIANLEATQARVRQFLADAGSVEEALMVNAELTRIEGELGQRKGRLNYLEQRAAFSTIAVELQEPEAEPTPSPTATVTPTATPPPPWRPAETAYGALGTLRSALRTLGDLLIWLLLAVLPLVLVVFGPPAAVLYLARKARRRPG